MILQIGRLPVYNLLGYIAQNMSSPLLKNVSILRNKCTGIENKNWTMDEPKAHSILSLITVSYEH